jgi:hypothetical protein
MYQTFHIAHVSRLSINLGTHSGNDSLVPNTLPTFKYLPLYQFFNISTYMLKYLILYYRSIFAIYC